MKYHVLPYFISQIFPKYPKIPLISYRLVLAATILGKSWKLWNLRTPEVYLVIHWAISTTVTLDSLTSHQSMHIAIQNGPWPSRNSCLVDIYTGYSVSPK